MRQLGKLDIVIEHARERGHMRQSYYQRKRVIGGHEGKAVCMVPENSNSNMSGKSTQKAKAEVVRLGPLKEEEADGRMMVDGP